VSYSDIALKSEEYYRQIETVLTNRVGVFSYETSGGMQVFPCHFAAAGHRLFFRSSCKSQHGAAIGDRSLSGVVGVWDEDVDTGRLRGLQIIGRMKRCDNADDVNFAIKTYQAKFESAQLAPVEKFLDPEELTTMYEFRLVSLKLFLDLDGSRYADTTHIVIPDDALA
jgi:hypothetical protein